MEPICGSNKEKNKSVEAIVWENCETNCLKQKCNKIKGIIQIYVVAK